MEGERLEAETGDEEEQGGLATVPAAEGGSDEAPAAVGLDENLARVVPARELRCVGRGWVCSPE